MTITEISKMSITERLQTMEALWDSLTHEIGELNSPDWHFDILSERKNKIESGDADFISLADLKSKNKQ